MLKRSKKKSAPSALVSLLPPLWALQLPINAKLKMFEIQISLKSAPKYVRTFSNSLYYTTFFVPFRTVWIHFNTFKALLTSETHFFGVVSARLLYFMDILGNRDF